MTKLKFLLPELQVIVAVAITAAASVAVAWLSRLLGAGGVQGTGLVLAPHVYFVLLLAQIFFCALVMAWARLTLGWRPKDWLEQLSWRTLWVGALVGAIPAAGKILWEIGKGNHLALSEALSGAPASGLAWATLSLIAMVPLNSAKEEMLFRRYAFEQLSSRVPVWPLVLSSLLFALMHFIGEPPSWWRLISTGGAGLCFGLLYLRTGNIFAPLAAHTTWNLGPVLMSGNVQLGGIFRYTERLEHQMDRPFSLAMIGCALLAIHFLLPARLQSAEDNLATAH